MKPLPLMRTAVPPVTEPERGAMALTVGHPSRPFTAVGVDRLVVVPSPSWDHALRPQQRARPSDVSAQVKSLPAATAVATPSSPVTVLGTNPPLSVPSPSCPALLAPQHLMAPLVISAHVWRSPASTAATPVPRPTTVDGVAWFTNVAFPSWPAAFRPQQRTVSAPAMANVW